jgi:phage antirepressor YoqD-like protein
MSIVPHSIALEGVNVRQDDHGRFCLTDLHKASGGAKKDQPSDWLQLEATQRLIAALDEEVKIPGNTGIQSKQGLGTFACLELVYDYAAWISPEFKLKVYRTFHATWRQEAPAPLRLTEAKRKAELLDKIAVLSTEPSESLTITEAAKLLDIKPKNLFAKLSACKWLYKRARNSRWLATGAALNAGWLTYKYTVYLDQDEMVERLSPQARITPRGLVKAGLLI